MPTRTLVSLSLLAAVACGDGDDNGDANDDGGTPPVVEPGVMSECVDADGEPAPDGRVRLSGTFLEDLTLQPPVFDADGDWTGEGCAEYLLRGGVYVGAGFYSGNGPRATLTVLPGTRIAGEFASGGLLVVNRGGQIDAQGTETSPIVLTSEFTAPDRNRGDWGGLVINGNAPINCDASDAETGFCEQGGEGGTGNYGGVDSADSSGILRYVRVEFAGQPLAPRFQSAGVSLRAVGSGTVVEYLQVHRAAEDGLALTGGTADLRYAVVTGAGDDSFTWTDGWTGRAQYVVLQSAEDGDAGDQGIQGANNAENNSFTPVSDPTLANFTILGNPDRDGTGILLRDGTRATISHTQVVGFGEAGLDIDDPATFDGVSLKQPSLGPLVFFSTRLDNPDAFAGNFRGDKIDAVPASSLESWFAFPTLRNVVGAPVPLPANGDLDVSGNLSEPTSPSFASDLQSAMSVESDGFLVEETLIGAVADESSDWTASWTSYPAN